MTLKFAFRNLNKRPFLNLIKVVGLSLALSAIILIALFLKNELSYDRFHNKSERIYRLTITHPDIFAGKHFARMFSAGFIPEMAEYFPEIENFVRMAPVRGGVLKCDRNVYTFDQGFICDSTFFELFDGKLLTGDPGIILDDPGSMIVSESFAKKVFGESDPVGQILTRPAGQFYGYNVDYTIKGVMKDFPRNSHFHPDFIFTPFDKTAFIGWAWTYLLLAPKAVPGNILSGFNDFFSLHNERAKDEIKETIHLQRISDIHLHSDKLREIESNSSMTVIYTLFIAAMILLSIALINYSNLNLGMAYYSDKYLFISKVAGSSRREELKYYLFEGMIIAIISLVVSIMIVSVIQIFLQQNFALNLFAGNLLLVLAVALLFCFLAIISGIFPVIKNIDAYFSRESKTGSGHKGISKSLIIIQYSISIALIVAVFVIHRQTNYALNSSLGTENDNIICFENVHTTVQQKFELFKNELVKYNTIKSVSAMFEPPGGEANDRFKFTMEGYMPEENNIAENTIHIFACDYSFTDIFNLTFLGGRNFSEKNRDNEGSGEYIINESAMRRFNYTDPEEIVGKRFGLIFHSDNITFPEGSITGVVEDFHFSSMRKKIDPIVLFKREHLWLSNFVISFQPGMQEEALSDIQAVWKKLFPGYPFQYEYISAMYKRVYNTERLQAGLLSLFTFIALFICSMGLLGMTLLVTQRRTREIGIRKVNGAGINSIMIMINWDMIKWIIVSVLIAVPLAYFAMEKWLEGFAYKTDLSWWLFALAGLLALLTALLTVSFHSRKAAGINPVEALRYE